MAELRNKLRSEVPKTELGGGTAGPESQVDPSTAAAGDQAEGDDQSEPGRGGGLGEAAAELEPMHSDARNFGLKDFRTWESHVAVRLGVSRRDVAAVRQQHLREGIHFVKTGRRVVYSDAGVARLAKALSNGGGQEGSLPTRVLCAPEALKTTFSFQVRRKVANRHVIECTDEAGKIVLVRVRRNENFLPGMKVEAVPYGDLVNVYEFTGRYPRFRGKY